jgi:GntR family transcriptional repressor for pyruvate dehydrogenase complex
MFQPMQETPRSLESRVVDAIRDLVESGKLAPGDRLPPERELAVQLGVSRTILRESLATLAALGMVEARHGRGVFVIGKSIQATAQRLTLALTSEGTTPQADLVARTRELFEIRRTLEGDAAAWAAQRASAEQLAELRLLLLRDQELRHASQPEIALINELDGRLHALIAASTANRLLVLLMATLLDELALARSNSLAIPERIIRSSWQHERIVTAIVARDPQQARASMLEHLNDVEQAILAKESNEMEV